MKRLCLVAITGVLLLGGGVVHAADTDNFTITQFDAEYRLGRDSERRSNLQVTWRITADFPPNQNHGIAPIFVRAYDGRPTEFQLQSVTDEQGRPLEHSWHREELRIGNKDGYVSGLQTYVIKYTQRDVTKYYADTDKTEFYWDVIGHQWRVPIRQATVRVMLDRAVQSAAQTEMKCYRGAQGSRESCGAVLAADGQYQLQLSNLAPAQGVTMALGFAPGTFQAYHLTTAGRAAALRQAVVWGVSGLSAVASIVLWYIARRWAGRHRSVGAIVPQYLPPKGISVSMSAHTLRGYRLLRTDRPTVMTAQLLDLAVRHYIKLYEVTTSDKPSDMQYQIEVSKPLDDLLAEEREIVEDMFGRLPKLGERLALEQLQDNAKYSDATLDDEDNLSALALQYGLQASDKKYRRWLRGIGLVALGLALMLGWWLGVWAAIGLALLAIVAYSVSSWRPLTPKGVALRRYLAGLKYYIEVAETERLQLLQAPGTVRTIDTTDARTMIRLYERVLPYAVLFGQEKEWSKQLGAYYTQLNTQPSWYAGQGRFDALSFAAGLSMLGATASLASAYSAATGGSSGGGFVGGGGGGGGGGGW